MHENTDMLWMHAQYELHDDEVRSRLDKVDPQSWYERLS
jgi:hypothetical protein